MAPLRRCWSPDQQPSKIYSKQSLLGAANNEESPQTSLVRLWRNLCASGASPDQQPSCHNYPKPHEALNNLTPDEWKRNLEITEIHKSNTVC